MGRGRITVTSQEGERVARRKLIRCCGLHCPRLYPAEESRILALAQLLAVPGICGSTYGYIWVCRNITLRGFCFLFFVNPITEEKPFPSLPILHRSTLSLFSYIHSLQLEAPPPLSNQRLPTVWIWLPPVCASTLVPSRNKVIFLISESQHVLVPISQRISSLWLSIAKPLPTQVGLVRILASQPVLLWGYSAVYSFMKLGRNTVERVSHNKDICKPS